MEINTVSPRDFQVIQGYDAGGFRISGQRYEGSVLVLPRRTVAWPVAAIEAVTTASFQPLKDELPRIEVLLLGTGGHPLSLPREFRLRLRDVYGVGIEVMDTGGACRTYNVLLAEGRPAAAALMTGG